MPKSIMMNTKKVIARLKYLSSMIAKYAHRWGENPSIRLCDWVDEYNRLREERPEAFAAYCRETGCDPSHNGYDCLA